MKDQINRFFGMQEDRNKIEQIKQISVELIDPSPYQPRAVFDDDRIKELCQTIKTHGVIQPIVVREKNDRYELIAGERRLRAVKKLQLEYVPAVIRSFNESQAASIALIENLQREGLSPVEEAAAYQNLIELHSLTQESLAQRLGKSQSTIANKLRLLGLPEPIKSALLERKITERHARALLTLSESDLQLRVFEEIIDKELNVKQTEMRIEAIKQPTDPKPKFKIKYPKDIRLAMNTIRQSIGLVSDTGMKIDTEEKEFDDHYEIVIKITK